MAKKRKKLSVKTRPLDSGVSVHYAGASQYATLALTDGQNREEQSGVPLPNPTDIREAKDWVDHNEK